MKKRILHCLIALRNAGAQSFIMNIYKGISHDEYVFDFMLRCDPSVNDGRLLDEVKRTGSRIIETSKYPRHFISNWKEVDRYLREHSGEYAAVHVHANSFLYVTPILISAKYGIPVRIIHSHNSKAGKRLYAPAHYVNRWLFGSKATDRIACSDLAGKWMFGDGDYLLIKNGIDLDRFRFSSAWREEIREELGVKDKKVIGNIGRFTAQKNHVLMIEIYKAYYEINRNSVLVLAGIGEEEDEIRKKVAAYHLQDHVVFLGLRRDAEKLYCAFDAFLMPSLYEGLPFTLVEAQTSGLPCVISDTISKDAVVFDFVKARALNGNIDDWTEALNDALTHPVRDRETYAGKMRQQGFDVNDAISKMVSIYNR